MLYAHFASIQASSFELLCRNLPLTVDNKGWGKKKEKE